MKPIYVVSDNVISPLGFTSAQNFSNIIENKSGLKAINLKTEEFTTYASYFSPYQCEQIFDTQNNELISKFENLIYKSIKQAVSNQEIDLSSNKTIFIFATTKGNIELINLPDVNYSKLNLYNSAQKITKLFKNNNKPVVISNACISGVAAIIMASRLLRANIYDNAVVCGADTVNDFVLSGFQSLKALSSEPCQPFDKNRMGVNLGEAGATLILSIHKNSNSKSPNIQIVGGSISNDANHISGPSRTGIELAMAINSAITESQLSTPQIDFISAHGTATEYNDEMEAKALTICQLNNTPINSLKAYFGHTLGVAGLLETIISIHSITNNIIVKSKGFNECGTSLPLNICESHINKILTHTIKIAAGFGGCNAALVISKN